MVNTTKRTFQRFCESTSLHGYGYLIVAKSFLAKVLWTVIIIVMTGIGMSFMVQNTKDYMDSKLVTTIETSTAPIDEAVFPSMTVCNFNQLEASFLRDLDIEENAELTDLVLIKEYMTGISRNYTETEQRNLTKIKEKLLSKDPYHDGRQWCRDLFMSMKFQKTKFYWNDIPDGTNNQPHFFGTDHGACCFLAPHVLIGLFAHNGSGYHKIHAPAKQGEEDGIELLFDVEQFNYGYMRGKGVGLKLSLNDHRDMPLMQFSSINVVAGRESQIVVKPVYTYTTDMALKDMSPEQRGCFESDKELEALPWEAGYRYEMSNCLVDQGLLSIYWNCRCVPFLAPLPKYNAYSMFLKQCSGKRLYCAHEVMEMMGDQAYMNKTPVYIDDEALKNPNKIGNITRKPHEICKPACNFQENQLIMSSAKYPPTKKNFFNKKSFCRVASHILLISCTNLNRKYFIELQYPQICKVLKDFQQVFGDPSSCNNWSRSYFELYDLINQTLVDQMLHYAEDNLARVNIFFQSPFMTKIKRDVEMTFTDFIANTGGLLGLYLGFSVISLLEIFYFTASFLRDLIAH